MESNVCYIASAGAGKTTWIVELLAERITKIDSDHKKIAVITYTDKNQEVLKNRIYAKFGYFPANIIILGWFEFLLKYWINPYKGDIIPTLYDKHIGIYFVESPSGIQKGNNGRYYYTYKENELEKKFLTSNKKRIYSDKLSEFAISCLNKNNPNILNRIDNIFDCILFDEAQDFTGFDFEVIKGLLKNCNLLCVLTADPRQHTFSTHISKKYQSYKGRIDAFVKEQVNTKRKTYIKVDETTLINSHRCVEAICKFSSKITPNYPQTKECICEKCIKRREEYKGLIGCYLVKEKDVYSFINIYSPITLTWNKKTSVPINVKERYNFGESKGWECDTAIIFCTDSMIKWLKNTTSNLSSETRAKFYVAVTRARYCTAIVVPDNFNNSDIDVPFWVL